MAKSKAAAADRAISKVSAHYKNSEWDIVDAATSGVIDLGNMNSNNLPSGMQNMNAKEREVYLRKTEKKRHELKSGINTLNEDRKDCILKKQKKNSPAQCLIQP